MDVLQIGDDGNIYTRPMGKAKQTKRNGTGGPASPVSQNEKFPCHWQSQICCRNIVCPSFVKEFMMRTVFMLNCHALTWAGAVQKPLGDLQNCKCQLKLLRPQVLESIWDDIGVKV